MSEQSRGTVQSASTALASGDLTSFLDLLDDDVTMNVPGRSELAGEHQGKDRVRWVFERETELCGGKTPDVDVHDVLESGEHGVLLHKVTFERDGRTLEDNSVLVFQLTDGRISAIWVHPQDQYANDEFWGGA